MADSKITALGSIGTGTDPANDQLVIVDVSDVLPTGMATTGTTKRVGLNQLLSSSPTATGAFSVTGLVTAGSATITGAATVGTTLGVTGAATFTGAVVCNGAVTLGDAVGDAINVTGSLTAYNGQAPSAIRAAASDYAAVAFDGATSGTRIVSTLTSQNIGTGDMSMWNRFRVFTTTGTTRYIASLSSSSTSADQARACILYINSIGGLVFYLYGATTSDFRSATIAGFQTLYSGQVVDIVVTRTGATLKIYINGTDTAYSEVTGGTPPAWSDTITSTNLFIGQSTGTSNIFSGRIYRSVVFNRALSAGDVTELITTGVNPADQWGTQTGQTSGTLVASKRYRITTYVSADSFTNVGAASNATGVEFVATGTTPTTWANASTLNRIGGLVDLDFTVGAGYQATDRSTNALHGTLFNGVDFTVPRRMAVLYATTSTNGNQQMLASTAIPTNAVIEDIIVNSTGTVTVSVGNASAGTQIVNAASVVSGRQKLTLATPFSTTGNLWVNANSTATLQFTILYTVAA